MKTSMTAYNMNIIYTRVYKSDIIGDVLRIISIVRFNQNLIKKSMLPIELTAHQWKLSITMNWIIFHSGIAPNE